MGRTRDQADQKRTQCLADIRVLQATQESTDSSPSLFGVGTVCSGRARLIANKSGKWYRGVVDAADRFMTRWHRVVIAQRFVAVACLNYSTGIPILAQSRVLFSLQLQQRCLIPISYWAKRCKTSDSQNSCFIFCKGFQCDLCLLSGCQDCFFFHVASITHNSPDTH